MPALDGALKWGTKHGTEISYFNTFSSHAPFCSLEEEKSYSIKLTARERTYTVQTTNLYSLSLTFHYLGMQLLSAMETKMKNYSKDTFF